ncbi:hypothetical protein ACP70R_005169 [Stipagrostis hirtigluma subsp. patula]
MASSLVFVESPFGPGRLMLAPAGVRLPAGVYPVTLLAVAGSPSRTSARGGHAVVAALDAGSPTGGAGRAASYAAASVVAALGAGSPTREAGRAAGFAAASVVAALGASSPAGGARVSGRGAGYAASVAAAAGLAGAGGLRTRGVYLVPAAAAGEPGDRADDVTQAQEKVLGDKEPGQGSGKEPFYPCMPYHASVSSEFQIIAERGVRLLDILVLKEQTFEPEDRIPSFDWADKCLRRVIAEGDKGFVLAEHVVEAMQGLQLVCHGLARRSNLWFVPEPTANVPDSTTIPETYFELLAEKFERMVSAVEEMA